MDDPPQTLGDVLRVIYDYYLRALVDDGLWRAWCRDAKVLASGCGPALEAVGGPVWWHDASRSGEADDTPYVVASLDGVCGLLRFDVAKLAELRGLAHPEDFDVDGWPLA